MHLSFHQEELTACIFWDEFANGRCRPGTHLCKGGRYETIDSFAHGWDERDSVSLFNYLNIHESIRQGINSLMASV